jgi:hypothetical protein
MHVASTATFQPAPYMVVKAFASNRSHVIAGLGKYWAAQANRLVPREVSASLTGDLMKSRALPAGTAR